MLTMSDCLSGYAADAEHYKSLHVQPIEIMQEIMTPEQFQGFLWGNLVKYALRCKAKGNPEADLEKAEQYAMWYKQALRGECIKAPK